MSLLRANDVAVLSGSIDMPLSGAWTADIVIDQPDGSGFDAGTEVTLKAADGLELKGSVVPERTGSFLDSVHVQLIGGKGGMGKVVRPRGYVQPSAYVRDVLNGLASDAGETLSTDIDSALLSTNLAAWTVPQLTTAQALNTLIQFLAPAAHWRFLADGKLWIGDETWPTVAHEFDVLENDPAQATYTLGIASPSILPGETVEGIGKVSRVVHTLGEDGVRSQVWANIDGQERGIKESIAAIVDQQMMAVDFYGLYECKVVSQSADLSTVDVSVLAPNDTRLPGLQRVELRAGTGVKVQLGPSANVLLGWKGGDPRYPYAQPGLGGDSFLRRELGTSPDNVVTKQDLQALIAAIAGATYLPGPGAATALTFTVPLPTTYASTVVKVQR